MGSFCHIVWEITKRESENILLDGVPDNMKHEGRTDIMHARDADNIDLMQVGTKECGVGVAQGDMH